MERRGYVVRRYAAVDPARNQMAADALAEGLQERLRLPTCNLHFGRPMVPFFLPLVRQGGGRDEETKVQAAKGDRQGIDQLSPATSHQPPTTSPWYLAEDFAFCERARQCGYQVMADTSIRLLHFGSYGYTWEDAGADPQRFGTFHFHLQPGADFRKS